MDEPSELSDAARRGLQRAAVHMMKAAIEVVAGLSAFLEEMGTVREHHDEPDDPPGREHIPVE